MSDSLALIAITGHGTLEAGIEALRLGFADFIQKPFDLEALARSVCRAVRQRRQREKLDSRFAELAESNARLESTEAQLNQKLQIASHDLVLSSRRMARQMDEVAVVANVARSLMGVLELEDLMGLCAELLGDRVPCQSSVVALYEAQEAAVGLMVRAHPDADVPPALCWLRSPLVSGVLCRAAQGQKTVHVSQVADSTLMDPLEKELWKDGRLMAVPIPFQGSSVGVVALHRTAQENDFAAQDAKLVAELAKTIGPAILTAKVHHHQRCQIYATLEAVTEALEARDPCMKGHSLRVLAYAEQMGPALELEASQVGALQIAARLHDIGRLIIPDAISHHAGPLTLDQWETVRRHSETGAAFLKNLDFLAEIASIVRAHHESYDGTGYPDMKAGDEIPLVSRLLAVADAFDAMTSPRPYRETLTNEAALDQIRQMAGQQFDPRVAEAFLQVPPDVLDDIRSRGR
jgi:response regulator RpfG family c-di-GMP phosphodiesterase